MNIRYLAYELLKNKDPAHKDFVSELSTDFQTGQQNNWH